MIAETPQILLWYLLGIATLGGIIGYCLSHLVLKARARKVIDALREDYVLERKAMDEEFQTARESIDVLRRTVDAQQEAVSTARQREEALDTHSQLQAQRIRSLEAQVATYEDQQIKLQRDFASYKSNKSRELEVARNTSDVTREAGKLPIVGRRILDDGTDGQDVLPPTPLYRKKPAANRIAAGKRGGSLSQPLSRELDIPTLAESELPDSVDQLDFESPIDPDDESQR